MKAWLYTLGVGIYDHDIFQGMVGIVLGMVGAVPFHLGDTTSMCRIVGIEEPVLRERQILGYFDLLGRRVENPVKGKIYIEKWDDGGMRKVVVW